MSETLDGFRERYLTALAGYVGGPDEAALRTAYELGREAVSQDLTVLELASAHHDALISVLDASAPAEVRAVTKAACDFFVESLSTFEMVRRGFREAREAALLEQRHAAILRQLSNFLADATVALDATASLEEMLQLVVEQARELLSTRRCHARVVVDGETPTTIEASSVADGGESKTGCDRISAAFVAWDGRELGMIEVADKTIGEFSDVDAAVLVHLAQMASAAVERARHYARGR
jgi:Phosphoserine phosphatase RsbU, N-terminal domain